MSVALLYMFRDVLYMYVQSLVYISHKSDIADTLFSADIVPYVSRARNAIMIHRLLTSAHKHNKLLSDTMKDAKQSMSYHTQITG